MGRFVFSLTVIHRANGRFTAMVHASNLGGHSSQRNPLLYCSLGSEKTIKQAILQMCPQPCRTPLLSLMPGGRSTSDPSLVLNLYPSPRVCTTRIKWMLCRSSAPRGISLSSSKLDQARQKRQRAIAVTENPRSSLHQIKKHKPARKVYV